MLNQIETAIKEALKQELGHFDIESFPAKFEEYSFTNSAGCILIRYDASDFSKQQTVWQVGQDETYSYSILTGLRSCATFEDCYETLKKIKTALQGLLICNFKVVLKRRQFIQDINGDLWWGLRLSLTLPTAEQKGIHG